jgi:hypothetical protein
MQIVLGGLVVAALGAMLVGSAPLSGSVHYAPAPSAAPLAVLVAPTSAATPMNYANSVPAASGAPGLTLGVGVSPAKICAFDQDTCAASVGMARVTLTANAGAGGVVAWPAVQVAFVIETTVYDGVYDPTAGDPGADSCASG